MLLALLVAGAAPQTAVDAERAFAADAQAIGQWSAFRKWAAEDAVMFLPQPTNAQAFLKPLKDPAKAVDWWPTASFVSCDETTAANTGGAVWPDGHAGYFSTIWSRNAGGTWRWTLDHGDDLAVARPRVTHPAVTVASCTGAPALPHFDVVDGAPAGNGASPDRTLVWDWSATRTGARRIAVRVWNGRGYDRVIDDAVAAPPTEAP